MIRLRFSPPFSIITMNFRVVPNRIFSRSQGTRPSTSRLTSSLIRSITRLTTRRSKFTILSFQRSRGHLSMLLRYHSLLFRSSAIKCTLYELFYHCNRVHQLHRCDLRVRFAHCALYARYAFWASFYQFRSPRFKARRLSGLFNISIQYSFSFNRGVSIFCQVVCSFDKGSIYYTHPFCIYEPSMCLLRTTYSLRQICKMCAPMVSSRLTGRCKERKQRPFRSCARPPHFHFSSKHVYKLHDHTKHFL